MWEQYVKGRPLQSVTAWRSCLLRIPGMTAVAGQLVYLLSTGGLPTSVLRVMPMASMVTASPAETWSLLMKFRAEGFHRATPHPSTSHKGK